jgi:CheY-like chemotaxis protein
LYDNEGGAQSLQFHDSMNGMLTAEKRYLAYVEDDEEDVELFQEVANSAGLLVQCFPNGAELLRHLESGENLPCLILLDLKNPVLSGPETYTRLQSSERLREIPVKYFSNSYEMMEREQRWAPDVEMITKPDVYGDWIALVGRLASFCRTAGSDTMA